MHESLTFQARAGLAIDFVSDMLQREGYTWVRAASSSMAPLIRPGDDLRLVPLAGGHLRPGAIVAFRRGGELVVHRVVDQRSEGVVTRGDALPDADSPVIWNDVIGGVAAIRTPSGQLVDLKRWPRPLIDRGLAALTSFSPSSRFAWIVRRALFHLVARLAR